MSKTETMFIKLTIPDKTDTTTGRTIGSNLLQSLVTAKKYPNATIIPEWNNMQFFSSKNFDIAPHIFNIPRVHNVMHINKNIFFNIDNKLEEWMRYCLNDFAGSKESLITLFTAGFPNVENKILIEELRKLYKNICPLNCNVTNYINNVIGTNNYISIYYRASGADDVRKIVTNKTNFIDKFIDKINVDDAEAIFLTSDDINIINYIKNKFSLPVYTKHYSTHDKISYYRQTIEELFILSKGKKIYKTWSKFGTASAILSKLPYSKIYTINPDGWENFMSKVPEINAGPIQTFLKSFKIY